MGFRVKVNSTAVTVQSHGGCTIFDGCLDTSRRMDMLMKMPTPIDAVAFDRATVPLLKILERDQARRIVDFHSDEALQTRIEELAEKANEGELTADESAEYQGYAQANQFIAVLQAKARQLLAS